MGIFLQLIQLNILKSKKKKKNINSFILKIISLENILKFGKLII